MVLTEFDEEKYEAIIRAEGFKEGNIKTLYVLFSKKILSMEECELTESEFLNEMKEYGLDK